MIIAWRGSFVITLQRKEYDLYKKYFSGIAEKEGKWRMLSCCFDSPLSEEQSPASFAVDSREHPSCAAVMMGDFLFLYGKVQAAFLQQAVGDSGNRLVISQDHGWLQLAEEIFEDAVRYQRQAFQFRRSAQVLDHLHHLSQHLPEGTRLEGIDRYWFEQSRSCSWMYDFCSQFPDYESYRRYGLGFVLTRQGKALSGASSYLVSKTGFAIQVQTADDQQNRGYALHTAAALIYAGVQRGKYPDWDADNAISARLAQRLGYLPGQQYPTVLVQRF